MDSRVMWCPGGEDIFSLHFSVHKVFLPIRNVYNLVRDTVKKVCC